MKPTMLRSVRYASDSESCLPLADHRLGQLLVLDLRDGDSRSEARDLFGLLPAADLAIEAAEEHRDPQAERCAGDSTEHATGRARARRRQPPVSTIGTASAVASVVKVRMLELSLSDLVLLQGDAVLVADGVGFGEQHLVVGSRPVALRSARRAGASVCRGVPATWRGGRCSPRPGELPGTCWSLRRRCRRAARPASAVGCVVVNVSAPVFRSKLTSTSLDSSAPVFELLELLGHLAGHLAGGGEQRDLSWRDRGRRGGGQLSVVQQQGVCCRDIAWAGIPARHFAGAGSAPSAAPATVRRAITHQRLRAAPSAEVLPIVPNPVGGDYLSAC